LQCEFAKDKDDIDRIIDEVKHTHGCQIVANGLMATLKYYFRLINNLEEFISLYSQLIEQDKELKNIHKETWNNLLMELENGI